MCHLHAKKQWVSFSVIIGIVMVSGCASVYDIAQKSDSSAKRIKAINKINVQEDLISLAIHGWYSDAKYLAATRIENADRNTWMKIARLTDSPEVAELAIKHLKADQRALKDLLESAHYFEVIAMMIKHIEDQRLLAGILSADYPKRRDTQIRYDAGEDGRGSMFTRHIGVDKERRLIAELKSSALDKITEDDILISILTSNNYDKKYRNVAAQKLSDKILYGIATDDNSDISSICMAISKISDPLLLKEIAREAEGKDAESTEEFAMKRRIKMNKILGKMARIRCLLIHPEIIKAIGEIDMELDCHEITQKYTNSTYYGEYVSLQLEGGNLPKPKEFLWRTEFTYWSNNIKPCPFNVGDVAAFILDQANLSVSQIPGNKQNAHLRAYYRNKTNKVLNKGNTPEVFKGSLPNAVRSKLKQYSRYTAQSFSAIAFDQYLTGDELDKWRYVTQLYCDPRKCIREFYSEMKKDDSDKAVTFVDTLVSNNIYIEKYNPEQPDESVLLVDVSLSYGRIRNVDMIVLCHGYTRTPYCIDLDFLIGQIESGAKEIIISNGKGDYVVCDAETIKNALGILYDYDFGQGHVILLEPSPLDRDGYTFSRLTSLIDIKYSIQGGIEFLRLESIFGEQPVSQGFGGPRSLIDLRDAATWLMTTAKDSLLVCASERGAVRKIEQTQEGLSVAIETDNGAYISCQKLKAAFVTVGQLVETGQYIGVQDNFLELPENVLEN